jgi:23S rRNA pseudouridine1911/1915/1917 synthase
VRIQKILLNGKQSKLAKRIKAGDRLEIFYSDPPALDVVPEKINLDIIYEDSSVCVINKPAGMVVHPGCGNHRHTLVNALLHHFEGLKNNFPAQELRPGIVHRLDKDTSGVIITAKNVRTLEYLSAQFKHRSVKKLYLALLKGGLKRTQGKIDTWIFRDPKHRKRFSCIPYTDDPPSGARRALTFFKVLKTWGDIHLVRLRPYTGRTHQLRVHMKYVNSPIIGDTLYGTKKTARNHESLMLHACSLRIKIPGKSEVQQYKAALPQRFKKFVRDVSRE